MATGETMDDPLEVPSLGVVPPDPPFGERHKARCACGASVVTATPDETFACTACKRWVRVVAP